MKKISCIILIIIIFLSGIYLYQARELTRFDLDKAFKNISEEMSITLEKSSQLFLYESQSMDTTYLVSIDINPRNRIKSVIKLDKYYSHINTDPNNSDRLVITNEDKEQDVLTLDISKLGMEQKLIKHKYIETINNSYGTFGSVDRFLFNNNAKESTLYNGYFYRFDIDSSVLIDGQKYQPTDFMPINYLYYLKQNI